MAEMLVRVAGKISDDPRKNAQLTKRGDVIVIQPDGWAWSAAERAGDPWLIVKVPGASVADLSAYVAAEPEDGSHKLLQRRAFHLDLDAHNGKSLSLARALALKKRKAAIPDPDVIA